mmetsp:Transcript_51898/g.151121  ORF Transcript_51898/g.151121 Transcript_51898/m.151121 type:complete len:200 (-) Transcript_51898:1019-1618(-)
MDDQDLAHGQTCDEQQADIPPQCIRLRKDAPRHALVDALIHETLRVAEGFAVERLETYDTIAEENNGRGHSAREILCGGGHANEGCLPARAIGAVNVLVDDPTLCSDTPYAKGALAHPVEGRPNQEHQAAEAQSAAFLIERTGTIKDNGNCEEDNREYDVQHPHPHDPPLDPKGIPALAHQAADQHSGTDIGDHIARAH